MLQFLSNLFGRSAEPVDPTDWDSPYATPDIIAILESCRELNHTQALKLHALVQGKSRNEIADDMVLCSARDQLHCYIYDLIDHISQTVISSGFSKNDFRGITMGGENRDQKCLFVTQALEPHLYRLCASEILRLKDLGFKTRPCISG